MSSFEQFIQERIYPQNVSPRTVDWYRQTFKWLEKFPLTEQGLKDLVIGMRQAGLQAISCNSRIRCINAYLKWAGLPLHIPKLREESKVMPTYTEEQLKRVIWAPNEVHPLTPWQSELDRLMQVQTTILDYKKRKQIYDRVQELVAQYDPVICLVSPKRPRGR